MAVGRATRIPLLARHIARRIGDAGQLDPLLAAIATSTDDSQLNLLLGLRDSLEGRYDMKSPAAWADVYPKLRSAGGEVSRIALQLSQQFGDSVAAEVMLQTLRDKSSSIEDRRQSLQGLAGRQRVELRDSLVELLSDDELRRDAIRAVSSFDDVSLAKELLKRYPNLSPEEKLEVINTLASRSGYGAELTAAIQSGAVPKRDVPAYIARLLRRVVGNRFVDVWGPIDELGADKEAMFAKYRELLKEDALSQANVANGRAVFNRTCAACHKLHGYGGSTGPDITGANRGNLEYLLSNILTPSAIIQDAYRMHIVLTEDGRIYSGIPVEENERQLKLRVADRDDPVTISVSQIESREIAAVSMMPEGTLMNLSDREVIDLIGYLQTLRQVDLSGAAVE